MKKICREKKSPLPKINVQDNYFYVVFKQNPQYLALAKEVEKAGEKLTKNQIKILEEIHKDKFIPATKLSKKVGISKRKIEENIYKLKKKGLLKRIGPAKGGYWKII